MIYTSKNFTTRIKESVKEEVLALKEQGEDVTLCVIQVGDDKASSSYIKSKCNASNEVFIDFTHKKEDETITTEELINVVNECQEKYDGVLVQLPLPKHIDESRIIASINPDSDVDGFHPLHTGNLWINQEAIAPCTAFGVAEWIEDILGDLNGRDVLIINRSNIVGKPLAKLLLDKNCTVTIAHSRTVDIVEKMKQSDVVITGVGIPNYINEEIIKELNGSKLKLIVDVSINMFEGKLCGDISKSTYEVFEDDYVSFDITSVPGGVGPITVSYLLKNAVKCHNIKKHLTK